MFYQLPIPALGWKLHALSVSPSILGRPALCCPVDCSPPGSSVRGILQARMLEWVSHSLLQGIFLTQGSNPCLLRCRRILYHLRAPREAQISCSAGDPGSIPGSGFPLFQVPDRGWDSSAFSPVWAAGWVPGPEKARRCVQRQLPGRGCQHPESVKSGHRDGPALPHSHQRPCLWLPAELTVRAPLVWG